MSEAYAFYDEQLARYRESESLRYRLHQDRQRMVREAKEEIASFAVPPLGMFSFTPEVLCVAGHRFASVRLGASGGDGGPHLAIAVAVLTVVDGRMRAICQDTGRDLGSAGPRDFLCQAMVGDRTVWEAVCWNKAFSADSFTLPMDAEIGDHPAGARMLELARRVANTKFAIEGAPFASPQLESLRRIEDCDDAIADAVLEMKFAVDDAERRIGRTASDAGFDPARDAPADLAADIKAMDWTHEEADRTIQSACDRERRIRRGLAGLPLDHALATMAAFGSCWFDYARSYLHGHPGHAKRPAAARAA